MIIHYLKTQNTIFSRHATERIVFFRLYAHHTSLQSNSVDTSKFQRLIAIVLKFLHRNLTRHYQNLMYLGDYQNLPNYWKGFYYLVLLIHQ